MGAAMTSPQSASEARREDARYPYLDRDGTLLYWVDRHVMPDGSKHFVQSRPSGVATAGTGALPAGGTVWGLRAGYYMRDTAALVWTAARNGAPGAVYLEECPRVPYQLPEVLTHDVLFTVEGEKDVYTLIDWGLVATTNPGGCGGGHLWAEPQWKENFRNKRIAHLFDNDVPGKKHVLAKTHALMGVATEQRIVELPGVGPGEDITDWRDAGHTLDELLALTRAAPVLDSAGVEALAARWGVAEAELQSKGGNARPNDTMLEAGVLITRRVSEIEARPIGWLWPYRIPSGKLTLIAGHPGLGKSQVTCDLAARVTAGGAWPGCDARAPGGAQVVILTAEDDAADTLRPRLEAAGADLNLVHIIDGVIRGYSGNGTQHQRQFSLESDLAALDHKLKELARVAIVIIDPISAYLGSIDSHVNAQVRGALGPVKDLAERHAAAFVAVSHMSKAGGTQALLRVTGSLAFIAAARAGYLVAADPENAMRCLFLPLKNNLARPQPGLAYRIEGVPVSSAAGLIETSRIVWDDAPVTMTADEVMAALDPEEASALHEAKDWLREILKDGPVSSTEIQRQAKALGISTATLRRAQKSLRIQARKRPGLKGGWDWVMEDAQDAHVQDARDADVQDAPVDRWIEEEI
jgi:hypothetical protein